MTSQIILSDVIQTAPNQIADISNVWRSMPESGKMAIYHLALSYKAKNEKRIIKAIYHLTLSRYFHLFYKGKKALNNNLKQA